MLLLLINLSVIVRSLAGLKDSPSPQQSLTQQLQFYGRTALPFALHFGWILAATVVSVNVVLVAHDFGPTIEYGAGAVGGLLAVLLAALVLLWFGYRTAPIVLIWALVGVVVELGSPAERIVMTFAEQQVRSVRFGAAAAATAIALALAIAVYRQVRGGNNNSQDDDDDEETPYVRTVDGAGRLG